MLQTDLIPANENPWYVLMTLYGEGEDAETSKRNRDVWNAWSLSDKTDAQRESLAAAAGVGGWSQHFWAREWRRIEQKHKAEMARRNDPDFEYPGFPKPRNDIRLVGVAFRQALRLDHFIFVSDLVLTRSHFEDSVNMHHAVMDASVFLAGAQFRASLGLAHATVRGRGTFYEAIFHQDAGFRGAAFQEEVIFERATFDGDAGFASTTFGGAVNFNEASFSGTASFAGASFKKEAAFLEASFSREATFVRSQFSDFTYFIDTQFGNIEGPSDCAAIFADCHFEKPTNFRYALFQDGYPDFSGAILHANTDFTAQSDFWPGTIEESKLAVAKETCGTIRHSLAQQGRAEDAHFFYRREMGFAGRIGRWYERLPYLLFHLMSDFGYSIWRPVIGLFALWLVGTLIYLIAFAARDVAAGLQQIDPSAAGLSFANMFKFLGFQRTYFDLEAIRALGPALSVMGAAQTILAFVLLFFLGLALRTRFRLR